MEGPSIYLAVEWLSPFIGKTIQSVEGNTKIGKERLQGKKVKDIFSWGKHLVFQFDVFAVRVHFLLFGSFEATVKETKVTGDYPTKNRPPRLKLSFKNGELIIYSASLKFLETSDAKNLYDFSIDVMSQDWDAHKALQTLKCYPHEEIGDALLDQSIFSGVGNIIKNEVLFLVKKLPTTRVKNFKASELKKLISLTHTFCFQFYSWRKQFALKKHYQVYRKSICPKCGAKICRKKTGKRERISFFCPVCQI